MFRTFINELEENRQRSDYEIGIPVSKEDSRKPTKDAKFLLEAALEICRSEGQNVIDP